MANSDEISQGIGDIDLEIVEAATRLNIAQEAQYKMKKELMDLSEVVRQGKFNLAKLRVERQIAERAFWASRS